MVEARLLKPVVAILPSAAAMVKPHGADLRGQGLKGDAVRSVALSYVYPESIAVVLRSNTDQVHTDVALRLSAHFDVDPVVKTFSDIRINHKIIVPVAIKYSRCCRDAALLPHRAPHDGYRCQHQHCCLLITLS